MVGDIHEVATRCLQGYPITVAEKMGLYTAMHRAGNHRAAGGCPPRVVRTLCRCGRTYRDRTDACFETFAAACLIHAALPEEIVRMILPLRTPMDPRVPRLVKAVCRDPAASDVVRRHVASKRSALAETTEQRRGRKICRRGC